MLDAKALRADLAATAANLARRGFQLDTAAVQKIEERRKQVQVEADRLRAQRNAGAKAVGIAKAKGEDVTALLAQGEALGAQLTQAEAALARLQQALTELQLGMRGLTTYAETVSNYGTEAVFLDGDDTPWSKAFLAAAYTSRGLKLRFTSGSGVEVLAFIRCVQPQTHDEAELAVFHRELKALPPVRKELVSFDYRMVAD